MLPSARATATAGPATVARDIESPTTVIPLPRGPYRAPMRDTIDASAWATFIREQLHERGLDARSAAQPNGPIPAGQVTIRRWLNSDRQVPTVDTVLKVCTALNYPPVRALIRMGVIPPAEAGVVGLAPTPPRMHKLARRLHDLLENTRIPATARAYLARVVEAAIDFWSAQMRLPAPPVEPSARERHAGATVTEPREHR